MVLRRSPRSRLTAPRTNSGHDSNEVPRQEEKASSQPTSDKQQKKKAGKTRVGAKSRASTVQGDVTATADEQRASTAKQAPSASSTCAKPGLSASGRVLVKRRGIAEYFAANPATPRASRTKTDKAWAQLEKSSERSLVQKGAPRTAKKDDPEDGTQSPCGTAGDKEDANRANDDPVQPVSRKADVDDCDDCDVDAVENPKPAADAVVEKPQIVVAKHRSASTGNADTAKSGSDVHKPIDAGNTVAVENNEAVPIDSEPSRTEQTIISVPATVAGEALHVRSPTLSTGNEKSEATGTQAAPKKGFATPQPVVPSKPDAEVAAALSVDGSAPSFDVVAPSVAPPCTNAEPPFSKKRKASYGSSFAARLKMRKTEAKAEKKPADMTNVKQDPDAVKVEKREEVSEEEIVPVANVKPKDKYIQLMREYVPHVEIAFHELSTVRCTAIAYMIEFDSNITDNELGMQELTTIFEGIMFVRMPEELKEKWDTPEGRHASGLRRMVMRSCLTMARKNLFGDFVQRDPDDHGNADLVTDADGNPVHPLWLLMVNNKKMRRRKKDDDPKGKVVKNEKERYSINAKTVAETVSRNEIRKTPKDEYNERKRIVNRGYPKRAEMGYYALNYLYHSLLKTFTKTRRTAKMNFFTAVGYLFMDWSNHDMLEVKDSAVHLRWAAPMKTSLLERLDVDEIKPSVTYKKRTTSSQNGNVNVFTDFVYAADDVVLLASHDVVVRTNKGEDSTVERGKRRRVGTERRVWKRAISLMEVVMRLLESLCGFQTAHPPFDILRAHEYSVPLVYTIARGLRRVLSALPGREIMDGPDAYVKHDDMTEAGDEGDTLDATGREGDETQGGGTVPDEDTVGTEIAERFMALFLTEEIATSFNLRQATCTLTDPAYWAEQIVDSNEATARFEHIDIECTAVDSGNDSSDDSEDFGVAPEMKSDEEDEFGDF